MVNIYPLTEEGNPTEDILKVVYNYLSDDRVRPLTDYVQVLSPLKHDFSIRTKIYLFKDSDETSVLATINAKLEEYKKQLSTKLGKSVIRTQIISILNSVYGVFKVDIETPSDILLEEYEWANLINYEIIVGGYANE